MKVRTAFTFDDRTLRTIRAAHGRGGVASRKECVTFIGRAVQEALRKAPEPKPARVKKAKVVPPVVAHIPPVLRTEEEEAVLARDRIRKMYLKGR